MVFTFDLLPRCAGGTHTLGHHPRPRPDRALSGPVRGESRISGGFKWLSKCFSSAPDRIGAGLGLEAAGVYRVTFRPTVLAAGWVGFPRPVGSPSSQC